MTYPTDHTLEPLAPGIAPEKAHATAPATGTVQTFETPVICAGPEDACEQSQALEREAAHQQVLNPKAWIYRAYWNAFEMALGELGWTPMSLLDVGCGDATMLSWVAKSNRWAKLHGLDFSRNIIESARQKHPCRIQYKVVSKEFGLPYPDESMDVVVSHAVLPSHVAPERLLKEMCRVSKEAVIISLVHPFFYNLVKWQPLSRYWHLNNRERIAYFRPEWVESQRLGDEMLRRVCFDTGFEVEWMASPLPFKLIMLRNPQRKKPFKSLVLPEHLPESKTPSETSITEAPV